MTKITCTHQQPKSIFLMGPTASNKTKLAIMLRQYLPVDIISVDSALIYRGMDIGTAKPSITELAQTPHRLIDIRDPSETYSAEKFCSDAYKEMKKITQSHRIPLLVGGTMFYFKALLEGLSPLPSVNFEIRKNILNEAKIMGWNALHKKLKNIDPLVAKRIHPNDSQRLLRALEVFLVSNRTLTELTKISGKPLKYKVYQFALAPLERTWLYQRITQRFHNMLDMGFEHEVSTLFSRHDLHRNMSSIRCVGYRQMWSYLVNEIDYDEMVFRGICATRQLAKRQICWLKRWRHINWLDSNKLDCALDKVLKMINI